MCTRFVYQEMASLVEAMEGRKRLWWALILCIHVVVTRAAGEESNDAKALQAFLQATLPPASQQSFNFSTGICTWAPMVTCANNRINGLLLEGIGLRGVIPKETIGNLSELRRLSLYNNSLKSPLPSDLWSLTSLEYLSLSLNSFEGEVPPQLSNLNRLHRLDLSQNSFHGPVLSQISELLGLKYLYLRSNRFSENIPGAVFEAASLVVIDLSYNSLSGPLPPQLASLSNLVTLNLSFNQLTGALPPIFSALHRLSNLDLSNNSFTGDLSSLNDSSSLEQVILSNNRFTGTLPYLTSFKVVRLNENLLSDRLQPALFGPKLSDLDLSFNGLSGDVSEFLNGSSKFITRLDLSSNKLSGSLSLVDFSIRTSLDYVDLSSNHIEGSIPESIGKATNLSYINLSKNKLNGSIPASFAQLTSLNYLDLSNNSLTGNVSQLLQVHSLKHLNLSFNNDLGCNSALVSKFGQDAFAGLLDCQPSAADIVLQSMKERSSDKLKGGVVPGIIGGCALAAVLLFVLLVLLACRRRGTWPNRSTLSLKKRALAYKEDGRFMSGPFSFESNSGPWAANVKNASSVPVIMFEKPLLNLTFADLLRATSSFNRETQVSQGGLGPVYSAVLPGDLHVSIKVLIEGRILTNQVAAAEFASLSKIKHPNLVPLLGYCIVGEERLVIYEFMQNGGLHRWLLGSPERFQGLQANNYSYYDVSTDLANRANVEPLPEAVNLSWPVRHKIALGVARALAFLHHGQSVKMVHRDVKASNVMLDEEFEPHLANTGLAGLLAGSEEALFAGGSPGYAPPEYGQAGGKVTTMGDVFSYGVILLELVTGKKPVGDSYEDVAAEYGVEFSGRPAISDLVGWVRMLMQEKRPGSLVRALDPGACEDQISEGQMLEVLRMGYLCTAELPSKRPTIQQVVGLLKDMAPNITSP